MKTPYFLGMLVMFFSYITAYGQAANMLTTSVKKTLAASVIDGSPVEWGNIDFFEITKITTGDKTKDITDTYGYWQAVWDDSYLYLHIGVIDDEYATAADKKDILEIYVDMNNNKALGGPNPEKPIENGPIVGPATQFAWKWADPTLAFTAPELFAEGGLGEGDDTLVIWARTNRENNLGYELEVAFPWNSLKPGFIAEAGKKISWDVNIADIDPNDDVKSDQYWSNDGTGSADPEMRPGLWRSVVMSGDLLFSGDIADMVNSINSGKQSNVTVYPNPVTDILYVRSNGSLTKAELFDILGKKVTDIDLSGSQNSLDVSSVKPGVYFLKLYNHNNLTETAKIIKK